LLNSALIAVNMFGTLSVLDLEVQAFFSNQISMVPLING